MEISHDEIYGLIGRLYAENFVLRQNNDTLVGAMPAIKARHDQELAEAVAEVKRKHAQKRKEKAPAHARS